MGPLIRAARPDDAERLRELTYASKAHWGYAPALVRAWADGLDFSPVRERFVAEREGETLGWSGLIPGDPCVLDDLWVDPPAMGQGVGAALFRHAAARARALGARSLEWGADPNAVGFYERMGGRVLRDHVSEWGRKTPWMGLDL